MKNKINPLAVNPDTLLDDLLMLAARKREQTFEALSANGKKANIVIRRNKWRRQQAAADEFKRQQAAAWNRARSFPNRITDRLAAAMEPGRWYSAHEAVRLVQKDPAGSNDALTGTMVAQRLVERVPHPEGFRTWRYRLSATGEAWRDAVRMCQ